MIRRIAKVPSHTCGFRPRCYLVLGHGWLFQHCSFRHRLKLFTNLISQSQWQFHLNTKDNINQKLMSFFRNFTKTINATRFTKPNNLILQQCCPPTYLCTSQEPTIDHLHSVKSLLRTINRLEGHKSNTGYQGFVNKELEMLNQSLGFYLDACVRYVEAGGRLTGQALANLYACADKLKVNPQWLKVYAESEIPHLIRYMSVDNLKDLKEGLTKNNGSSDFVNLVEKQLSSRNQEPYEYVKRAVNEIAVFEEVSSPFSHNSLVNAIEAKQSPLLFNAWRYSRLPFDWFTSYFQKRPINYALD